MIIDPQQGPFGRVINGLPVPTGCANAIDIDPTTDTAYLGCSTGPQAILDLRSGASVQLSPLSGTDVGQFNPHNRRWYSGSDNRSTAASVTLPCPKSSDGRTPVVAVYSNAPQVNQFVGVACGGRGGIRAGVDPVNNNIVYPVVQYPADPASADTGSPGVLVFHDTATDVFGVPAGSVEALTQASLSAVGAGASAVTGSANFSLRRRNMFVDASMTGLPAGSTSTRLIVTTSAGNEVVNCGVNGSGTAFCQGDLVGDPLIGGVVAVGLAGTRVASGNIALVATFPTFIPTDKAAAQRRNSETNGELGNYAMRIHFRIAAGLVRNKESRARSR